MNSIFNYTECLRVVNCANVLRYVKFKPYLVKTKLS